jgi:hypothetical protein
MFTDEVELAVGYKDVQGVFGELLWGIEPEPIEGRHVCYLEDHCIIK